MPNRARVTMALALAMCAAPSMGQNLVIGPGVTIVDGYIGTTGVTHLDMSNAVAATEIGFQAFRGTSLVSIDLSGATSVTVMGNSVFRSSGSLDTADLSGLVQQPEIPETTFDSSTLRVVSGMNGMAALTTIGMGAFRMTSLEAIDLSGNAALRSIGQEACATRDDDPSHGACRAALGPFQTNAMRPTRTPAPTPCTLRFHLLVRSANMTPALTRHMAPVIYSRA
jgi:hypothetical protein